MRRAGLIALAVVAVVAAACAGASDSNGTDTPERSDDAADGRGVLGGTDTGVRSVDLADIHFDTFSGGSIPLSEIEEDTLLSLRDAIPPLDEPEYEPAERGDWLDPDDFVIGYVAADGRAYAYPFNILNFHEIVNDELGGEPVLISYCPLCRSAIVYSRELDGRVLEFGNTSALYESDLVMYDRETLSYWFQVGGEAIVGELTGSRLAPLASVAVPWEEWRSLHPDTLVLSRDTGFQRDYTRDPFEGYQGRVNDGRIPFPVTEATEDGRLDPGAIVLAVEAGDEARAYPVEARGDAAINDTVGGERVAVLVDGDGPSAAAYRPAADGRARTFEVSDGAFVDVETGSEWSLAGEAVSGPLEGERLEPLPSRSTFWFAYIAAVPDATVYEP